MGTLEWLQLATGASFALAGLIAWRVRPANRTGAIMVAYGVATMAGRGLIQTLWPPAVTLGIILMDGAAIVFTLLLLTFPTGRLASRRDWLILGPVMLALGPIELVWLVFFDLDGLNLLAFWPNEDLAGAIDWVQRVLLGGASAALVIVVVRRWLRASRPMRRTLIPVLAGAGALAVGTFTLLWDKIAGARTEFIGWLTALTLFALPILLLVNLLRARLARSAVGQLLVDLREDKDPAALPAALSRALGDPSLELAYWLPEYDAYADLAGNPVELPAEDATRSVTVLERADGSRIAALLHDASLYDQRDLLREVSAAASFALENARLQAELRVRLDELHGSRVRIIEAADTERRRLERDLHDGAQQRLVTLSMSLGVLERRLADDPEARALVAEAKREAAGSLQDLRDLAHGIHPAVLTSHGLEAALESLAAGAPLHVGLDVELPDRLPATTEVAAYYLICEALTNTAKHAHADHARIFVRREEDSLLVEFADDGVGGADDSGSGLRGLADRVEALDGSLAVVSPQGAGTHLRAEIPCA